MLEAPEALAVKENQYGYNFGIGKTSGLVAMDFAIADLMFFEFRCRKRSIPTQPERLNPPIMTVEIGYKLA